MEDWKKRLGSYDSMNEAIFITIDGETIYTIDNLVDFIEQELSKAREEGYADGVEHRKRRAMKYFMDGKVGDDLDLVEYADSTYKLTTK